jgi:hypothetical protein
MMKTGKNMETIIINVLLILICIILLFLCLIDVICVIFHATLQGERR